MSSRGKTRRPPHRRKEPHHPTLFPLIAAIGMLVLVVVLSAVANARELSRAQRLKFIASALDSVPEEAGRQRTLSPYFFVFSDDPETDRLPLKHTGAAVNILGGAIADVTVTQVYRNEGETTLEAIYLFPASTRAAVHAMRMTVGERVIEAKIEKRAQARKDYEQALEEGRTASLLEQQRPNVFQISVGNILPDDEVRVELSYTELIFPEQKTYEFVYPTVVGPRYSNTPAAGAPDTESWVSNPYLRAGQAPTYSFDMQVHLRCGFPIARIGSPSHDLEVEYEGEQVAHIVLEDGERAGNRDFVLRYRLASDAIETGLLLFPGDDENYFLMMMEPPERVEPRDVVPREYIFIQDVSGSMNGFPLETSKALMRKLFRSLRGEDYFNVLTFAGGSAVLGERSLSATPENIERGVRWLEGFGGGGGTEILPALKRALALPRTPGTSRIVVVATDGYVHVEQQTFELVRERLGEANLFAFGIGSSVNRLIIEGMAHAGLGEPFVVLDGAEAPKQAARFQEYISAPLLQGVKVEFDGFEAYDVEPPAMPDLFAERPLVVFGKYRGEPEGRILVSGNTPGESLSAEVEVTPELASQSNAALRLLWARQRIRRLADMHRLWPSGQTTNAVTELGLKYGLLTDFTSFVAVDTEVRADGSKRTRVRQPLPLPAGVSDAAVGGAAGNAGVLGVLSTSGQGSGGGVGYGFGIGHLGTKGHGGGVAHGRSAGSAIRGKVAAPMIMGSMDKNQIQSVIRKHIKRIKLCYEKGLKRNPQLHGRVEVRLTIGPDGTVTKAEIARSTLNDKQVEQEMLKVLRQLKFPKPAGGGTMTVSYPFIFAP